MKKKAKLKFKLGDVIYLIDGAEYLYADDRHRVINLEVKKSFALILDVIHVENPLLIKLKDSDIAQPPSTPGSLPCIDRYLLQNETSEFYHGYKIHWFHRSKTIKEMIEISNIEKAFYALG